MDFDRSQWSGENCSAKRTLEIVGEKWTFLVLREAYYGARRFEQFHAGIGCARNLLTDRLNTLVEHGLLQRSPYQEPGARQRNEYRLTEAGIDLFPALVALMQWGDRWVADPEGPAVEITHRDCGQLVKADLRCSANHTGLTARDTVPRPGPGARRAG
ncbi:MULTISPECIES: helix-turn-helix domain-containing protein [unclassified Mycobacterium]|uniref:winged helix-turn-helix transcriptional regulator n=1 Tax=unclassified Mycobacterium TaxID=2642494 RepID=UPI0007FDED46|nr:MULTISPECIES: helix-turn-helix domain-containing protein [unclassified Mycobacterium]OBG78356.1 transcriptional regulator [Mycobacterium sp. E1214]OBH22830.1 transcriptional regulator [Mycobacterium sp. E1319]